MYNQKKVNQERSTSLKLDFPAQQAQAHELHEAGGNLERQNTQQQLNQKALKFLFGAIFFTNLLINMDHGILPACTTELKKDLHLDNEKLGLLGSLVYAGQVLGSLSAMPFFNYCNTKFVLITCLLLNCASLILFTLSDQYGLLVLSRVFFCIYFPVWVDLFADEKRKTVWLTTILLGIPLGIILGYITTAFLITFLEWRWSFYLQAGCLLPLSLCYMFTPARFMIYTEKHGDHDDMSKMTESLNFYNLSNFESHSKINGSSFHKKGYHRRDSSNVIAQSQQSHHQDGAESPSFGMFPSAQERDDRSFNTDKRPVGFKGLQPSSEQRTNSLQFDKSQLQSNLLRDHLDYDYKRAEQGFKKHKQPREQIEKRQRANSSITLKLRRQKERQMRKLSKMVEHYTLKQKIIYLLTNFNFMILLLALTSVYFYTTGIQFWITDYFTIVLGQSKSFSFLTFGVCALTGPVLGVVIGGYIFDCIGGYNGPKAYPLAVLVMVCGTVSGIPLPSLSNFYVFAFLIWLQFFFGGFCIPVLTGILLNSVPPPLRTIANSIANLVYNLLGYLPAPYVYGLVYELDGGGTSSAGLIAIELGSVLTSILMIILLIKKQALEKEEKETHKKKFLPQGGAALDLLDNDQIGPLLSQTGDDDHSVFRKRKEIEPQIISDDEDDDEMDDDDYMNDRRSFKTPVSDRIRLESTSVLYSKTVYPLSLGIHEEE